MADEGINTDDELFDSLEAELEKDGTFDYYRNQRISQAQDTLREHENLNKRFIYYNNEKEFLESSKSISNGNYIVVFINDQFLACQILLTALKSVIQRSSGVYSVCILEAVNSPFLVNKLNIKILPTLVVYKNQQQRLIHVGLQGFLDSINDIHSLNESKLARLISSYYSTKSRSKDDSDDSDY